MATQSHAHKAIALREGYEKMSVALREERLFTSDQAERHTIGRYQALEYLAANLSSIVVGMRPAQVHEAILRELHRLAEAKATWLVNSIRNRRQYHINELGEWTAEGAIEQIDEMAPQLRALLIPRLTPTSGVHGRYFQVFQRLYPLGGTDPRRHATRWTWARQRWYQEVAILEFGEEDVTAEQVHLRLGLVGRREGPQVFWSVNGADLARTGPGDVIVSLLSREAWLLDDDGPRPLAALLTESPATGIAESAEGARANGLFEQFASRYRLALRIDDGPLPPSCLDEDPFFQSLRERYQGETPPHDFWKLALSFLDEGGEPRPGSQGLPLAWEGDSRPVLPEVLAVLRNMIDSVWDAALGSCTREVWEEYGYGSTYTDPAESDRAFAAQSWNAICLRGFLLSEAFDALSSIDG